MDKIKQTFEKMKNQALSDGAAVELLISGGESLSFSSQKRKIDKFNSSQSCIAGVRIIKNGVQGISFTENLSEDSLLRTYQDAYQNALTVGGAQESVEWCGFVSPNDGNSVSMSSLFQEENISMEAKKEKALSFEALCLDADARIQSVPYNGMSETIAWRRILNSAGLDREFKQKYWSGYSYALAKDGEFSKMSGESSFSRKFAELRPKEVSEVSVKKATEMLGAKKLTTGLYPVVIDRDCMGSFIQMMIGYFSAKEVFENKSLLKGKLNQQIAVEHFELIDDPLDFDGLSVRPFDSEGAISKITTLIGDGGILKNYLTNLEYAKKMNLPHTAHAERSPASGMGISASNVKVSKGSSSFNDMKEKHSKFLHLTNIAGSLHSGFKDSTGDFSLPCEGFLYENGVKVGPVDQFVLSGNILNLLMNIEMIGNEWNKKGSSIFTPDIMVRELSVAGA